MKTFLKRFCLLLTTGALLLIFLFFSYTFISGTDPVQRFYWVYCWHYPLQYLFILALLYALVFTFMIKHLMNISSSVKRSGIELGISISIGIPFFVLSIILYCFHNRGFRPDSIPEIISDISAYWPMALYGGKELLITLLPLEALYLFTGIMIIECYISILKKRNL